MKKILATACALALATCVGTTAFAGTITSTSEDNFESNEVYLTATPEPTPAETISVEVTWTNETITYTPGTAATGWEPEQHKYGTDAIAGSWSDPFRVTVTNNSNVAVGVGGRYTSDYYQNGIPNANGVTLTFADFEIDTLAAGTPENSPLGEGVDNVSSATVTASGAPTQSLSSEVGGTVTVTITPAAG